MKTIKNIKFNSKSFLGTVSFNSLGLSQHYSTESVALTVVPIVRYSNADLDKDLIIKENTGKSGIYR
jgi:hypothetical protein